MIFQYKTKYSYLLLLFFISISFFAQSNRFVVTLDAGHGGGDFGASYNGHVEKKIALAVTLKVGAILKKNRSIEVVFTRETDTFIPLDDRAKIANKANSTIFVSIHCNANASPAGQGHETYVMGAGRNKSNLEVAKLENSVISLEKDFKTTYEGYNPNAPESIIGIMMQQEVYVENSIELAGRIQNNFSLNKSRKNRGVKEAGFLVLRKIAMPRVLIEIGFISNQTEGEFLDSDEGQDEVATSIAAAIVDYKNEYYGSSSNEPTIEKLVPRNLKEVVVEKPVIKAPEITVKTPVEINSSVTGIIFKIQISASGKKLDPIASNFKGLNNMSVSNDNGSLYKYFYGNTINYDEAKQNLAEAKEKGYTSAYIVSFKDGKKIDLKEALQNNKPQ
jgi:N-acetylmuramoyl-L-alanine amidase